MTRKVDNGTCKTYLIPNLHYLAVQPALDHAKSLPYKHKLHLPEQKALLDEFDGDTISSFRIPNSKKLQEEN
jgi:hypothetical protein